MIVEKFIGLYHRYENLNLKITFILISLQLLHLYWLTTDIVLQKIFGKSLFLFPKDLLAIFVIIDYIEIPALVSGIIFYAHNIHYREENIKRSYIFLAMLSVQVIHIFWLTDNVVYSSSFKSSFVEIPFILSWAAILIDYLEIPIIVDLFYKIIRKGRK